MKHEDVDRIFVYTMFTLTVATLVIGIVSLLAS